MTLPDIGWAHLLIDVLSIYIAGWVIYEATHPPRRKNRRIKPPKIARRGARLADPSPESLRGERLTKFKGWTS